MRYIKTFESVIRNRITFRRWLKTHPKDINSKSINCLLQNLVDLNGINKFKNLVFLDCSNNYLKELPYLNNLTNLKFLYCSNNEITKLPDLSNLKNLEVLNCSNNQLTELPDLFDILGNLKKLKCSNNNLPYSNLEEYIEWHKQQYSWKWEAKKYNL